GGLLRVGRREPAAALRPDARAVARPLRDAPGRGGAALRRALRADLATLPGGLDRRLPHRLAAALPGGVRPRAVERRAVDARRPLPAVSARSRPIVGVMGSGEERHDALAAPLGRWIARQGCHLLT